MKSLQPRHRSMWWLNGMPAAGLLVMTLVALAPTIGGDFLLDDDSYVKSNATLRTAGGLARIWLDPQANQQYYPVVFTTFWIEYHLWGLNTAGYHVVNIALHALNAILVWRLLRRLGVPAAWFAAALFALHPVQVESAGWIQERKNVLAGFFFLAAIAAYLRYALPDSLVGAGSAELHDDSGSRIRLGGWYSLALVLSACAFLSKSATCPLPAVLALVLCWKRGRLGRGDVLALVPMIVLAIAAGLTTVWVEKHLYLGGADETWSLTLAERFLIAGRALWFYAGKLVWPASLTIIYPRWQVDAGDWRQYLFLLAAGAIPIVLWLLRGRIGRGPLAAVLFYFGMLLPTLGFVNFYNMRQTFVADHFLYLPCIGFFALAAASVALVAQRLPLRRVVVIGGAAGVLLALASLTFEQGWLFRDQDKLWADTLEKNPGSWMAHHNLGTSLGRQEQFAKAIQHLQAAVRLRPGYVVARYNLGKLLAQVGQVEQAKMQLREVIRLQPKGNDARVVLGALCAAQHELDEAAKYLTEETNLNPDSAVAFDVLGQVRAEQTNWYEAVACWRRACRLLPEVPRYHVLLAEALRQVGANTEAEEQLTEAQRLEQHPR